MLRLRGLVVLVVEDDVDNLELLVSYLEGEGAVVLGAGSIAAALAQTIEKRIDVVVSDLELTDGDGCALVKQLRSREALAQLPAIAITGYSDQKSRNKAADGGFVRYAVKPFSLDILVDWIAELSAAPARASRFST